jgi:hypothetical protein
MAHMWDESDWGNLVLMIRLHDQVWKNESARVAAELRQWLDRYGLTPAGRQSRRWRLPADRDPIDRKKARHPSQTAKGRKERILKAVT